MLGPEARVHPCGSCLGLVPTGDRAGQVKCSSMHLVLSDLGPWPDVTKAAIARGWKEWDSVWVALVALGLWARVCAT